MNRIACVVLLFVASIAAAATPQREVTNVEVVQVPVFVTARGESVRGLTRDDFNIFVNGKPQSIDYFDVLDFAAAPSPGDQRPDPRQRRLYFFVFDLTFSNPAAIHRAQLGVGRFLESAPPSDLFAVGSFSSGHGLEIVVPFTRDRLAVKRAVGRLRGYGDDPLHLAIGPAERSTLLATERLFGTDEREGHGFADFALEMLRDAATAEVDTLAELADRLAPLEGQKHVVLLSTGFQATPFFGGFLPRVGSTTYQTATYQPLTPEPPRAIPIAAHPDASFAGNVVRMHQRFNASGVVLDSVDIFGIPSAFDRRNDDALYALSLDTGGTVIDNRNDLAQAIQNLTDGQRVVYLLGFRPPATGRQTNSIKVKVQAARGTQVVYRRSYSSTPPDVPNNDALRLADVLENDIPQTGVSVALKTVPSRRRASVTVDIPSKELTALGGTDGDAMIYIYSGHAVVAFQHRAVSAEHSQLNETFDLPPGLYTAKVLVRWNDALGFARSDFAIE